MAKWHPSSFSDRELFVVGSMKKPRCIEIFDDKGELLKEIRGEALTAVEVGVVSILLPASLFWWVVIVVVG